MGRIRPGSIFLLFIFILFSCAAQKNYFSFPVPEKNIYENERPVEIENITESMDTDLPVWLSAYLNGGIGEAEKLEAYAGKYLFIAESQGANFAALTKWADNFSVEHDFPMLAAERIDKRMNVSSSMYPDEEYGVFYEALMKNAYIGEYRGTVKEDTYWIKIRVAENDAAMPEVFGFFVLISVDIEEMQNIIYDFYSKALAVSVPTRSQAAAINRLRQNFFEGF